MEPGDSPAMELTPELRTFFGSRLGAPSLPRRRAAAAAVLRSGDVHRHTPRPVPRHEILHLCWLIVSNMVKSPLIRRNATYSKQCQTAFKKIGMGQDSKMLDV